MTLHNAYTPARETLPRLAHALRRRPAANTVRDELSRLLKSGVSTGVRDVFGSGTKSGGSALEGKLMENAFDAMVAGALTRGRQTSSVLGTLFNLSPTLSGR